MSFVSKDLDGASFFTSIRTSIGADRMFQGIDSTGFRYLVLDATFYRIEIFERTPIDTFTDSAISTQVADPTKRIIVNGQVFNEYNWVSHGPIQPGSQIIVNGVIKPGVAIAPLMRHMGQWKGKTEKSFGFAENQPDTIVSPSTYQNALGRLIPLIENGTVSVEAKLGNWISEPSSTGKIIYGIDRINQLLLVVIQEDDVSPGISITDMQKRLSNIGIYYAVMGDGSDSALLVLDNSIVVTPGSLKNRSIPNGVIYKIISPSTDTSNSKLTIDTSNTTDTDFLNSGDTNNPFGFDLDLTEVNATFSLTSTGIGLEIASWGKCLDNSNNRVSADTLMPISTPFNMETTSNNLTLSNVFSNGGNVTGNMKLTVTNEDDLGTISGDLMIMNGSLKLVMNISWKLKN